MPKDDLMVDAEMEGVREVVALEDLEASLPASGRKSLANHLNIAVAGRKEDLRTPWYNGSDRSELISECLNITEVPGFVELNDLNEKEAKKVGPYSIQLPSDQRIPGLQREWLQEKPKLTDSEFDALATAEAHLLTLGPRGVRPMSWESALRAVPSDSNLGLPHLTHNRGALGSYLDRAMKANSHEDIYPNMWWWRGQPDGLEGPPKQRNIRGFDKAEFLIGARFMYPLLNWFKVHAPGFSAWSGPDSVDSEVTRILQRSSGPILSMDYSGFDDTCSYMLIRAVFRCIKAWYNGMYDDELQLSEDIFLFTGIVVPYEVWTGRVGGIPSGSVWTQFVGSMLNLLVGLYIGYVSDNPLKDYSILGDDGVLSYRGGIDVDTVADIIDALGMEANPDKQWISETSVHYLQRWHSIDYNRNGVNVGVRPPARTLTGLTGYETFKDPKRWNKYLDSARFIMNAENVRHHPKFLEYVRFIVEGDEVLQQLPPEKVISRAGKDEVEWALDLSSRPHPDRDPDAVGTFEFTRAYHQLY